MGPFISEIMDMSLLYDRHTCVGPFPPAGFHGTRSGGLWGVATGLIGGRRFGFYKGRK